VNFPDTVRQSRTNAHDQLQSALNTLLRKGVTCDDPSDLLSDTALLEAVRTLLEIDALKAPTALAITKDKVYEVASKDKAIRIPIKKDDTRTDFDAYLRLEEIISERIKGHDEVISAIASSIRRARVGLNFPQSPVGSFLLLGPTGIGKTEIALSVAKLIFQNSLIDVNMNQLPPGEAGYEALIGSPRGIRGFGENQDQLLTKRIMQSPSSVLLLDEIEKAYVRLFDLLLPALEDGILTDNMGDTANLNELLMILTSNIGLPPDSELYDEIKAVLLKDDDVAYETLVEKIDVHVRQALAESIFKYRPELLNRLSGIFVLKPLKRDVAKAIVGKLLDDYVQDMALAGYEVVFGTSEEERNEILDLLIEEGTLERR